MWLFMPTFIPLLLVSSHEVKAIPSLRFIIFLKARLNKEISDRTGQPLDRIQQDTDRDFFMSPTEAVNYGLIDSVIDKRPVQAVA